MTNVYTALSVKSVCRTLSLCLILVIFPLSALAHRAFLLTWIENGHVKVQGKYGNQAVIKNAKVTVFDPEQNLMLSGTTNEIGIFAFPILQQKELIVVLSTPAGHKAETRMLAEDYPQHSAPQDRSPSPKSPQAPLSTQHSNESWNQEQLQLLISQSLEAELSVLSHQVKKLENKIEEPSLQDIFGGIGYLLGLMGVGAYFHYRQKLKEISPS